MRTILTPHSTLLTPRDTLLTPRDTLLTPHSTLLTPRNNHLMSLGSAFDIPIVAIAKVLAEDDLQRLTEILRDLKDILAVLSREFVA